MRFDPPTGKLVCDFCGTVMDIPKVEPAAQTKPKKPAPKPKDESAVEGFDFSALNDQASDAAAESLPVYNCVSCGAEVIAPAEQMALTCPYCGNNIVLTEKVTGSLRPDGVIPFKIVSGDLPDAVNRYYKDKKLLPKGFFSESTMGSVTGVYLPFWVFGGRLSGSLTFRGEKSRTRREGDYVVTTTDYYQLDRDASMAFQDVPVDASGKVDDKLMDSLEPFDMSQVQPFDMRYLAGFTADRFDQKKQDISSRAEQRMQNSAGTVVEARAGRGYANVRKTGGKLKADLTAKYLLFPVYMFDINHGKKSYHFAVNGQTGKVVGELPIDKGVSWMYFLKRFGILAGIILLLSFGTYMLGV